MNTPVESKGQERRLTTTSYAVLAVLALRDHSTYELTKQMHLSMHYLWPRAESNVYAEPKRLVAAGLATSREEWTGERRRTVYSITDEGRAALTAWLAAPSARQRYESEAALKVLFGEQGSHEDLLASIRALRDDAESVVAHWRAIADAYAAGEGEHPQRFAVSALVGRLISEQQTATYRWATWAERVVSTWDEDSPSDVDWGVAAIRAAGEPFEQTGGHRPAHRLASGADGASAGVGRTEANSEG